MVDRGEEIRVQPDNTEQVIILITLLIQYTVHSNFSWAHSSYKAGTHFDIPLTLST